MMAIRSTCGKSGCVVPQQNFAHSPFGLQGPYGRAYVDIGVLYCCLQFFCPDTAIRHTLPSLRDIVDYIMRDKGGHLALSCCGTLIGRKGAFLRRLSGALLRTRARQGWCRGLVTKTKGQQPPSRNKQRTPTEENTRGGPSNHMHTPCTHPARTLFSPPLLSKVCSTDRQTDLVGCLPGANSRPHGTA